ILFGMKMRNESTAELLNILQEELLTNMQDDRLNMRAEVRRQIEKAQESYKKNYDKKRKMAKGFKVGDLVAIKTTQFITGHKLARKYIGPYEISKVKRNGRYDVTKSAIFEGPHQTSTSEDYMKPWQLHNEGYSDEDEDLEVKESSEA
ncbi:hypothetical protein KR222_011146, partial [Zaprionus bogoriensis]